MKLLVTQMQNQDPLNPIEQCGPDGTDGITDCP